MFAAEELAAMMGAFAHSPEAQLAQTRFRMDLVESWEIRAGHRILEIGCGQGDATLALANVVGDKGSVLGVDIADPSYGAPSTLGESADAVKMSPLGDRIEFRFEFDTLSANFEEEAFDAVVLSHCTWYFPSLDILRQILEKVKPWSPKLCLSEWDLEPRTIDQLPHLLAVLVQGQVEAFKPSSQANVRTPYSREALSRTLSETGWQIQSQQHVDAAELDDGRWEVDACLNSSKREARDLDLPTKLLGLIESQTDVLRRLSERGRPAPLPSYSMVANRRES